MPAPASTDEFLDLIRKSGVVEEPRLVAYIKKLQSISNPPADISKFAGLFVRDGLLTFFQAEQFLLGKWKRFTIGKYKVLERLGSGGMGQVFLCEHKLMRRKVAVKVLPTAKAEDPSSLERFYREARAVAALDHPNIVRAYDIDQDDNLHFIVMEYVDGVSFQDLIKKHGRLDVTRACHYMYWSAIGLQHAHESGLIHRDIKPGNILIDRLGTVKILDLGLARFFNDDEDNLTKKYDENVLGTADYLAPEQALDSHSVDGRADIYSLGATFYYLLTGHQPFVEGTIAQKLIWHQTRNPRSLRDLRPEVPEGVVEIVEKMMAKEPANRYQSPLELAEALSPWVQTPIGPPPDKEMPIVSAAAQNISAGTPTTPVRQVPQMPSKPAPGSGTSRDPGAGARGPSSQPPSDSGKRSPQPVRSSTPDPSKNSSTEDTKRRSLPAPIVETLPAESEPAVWESLAADTNNATRDNTDRQPTPKPKPKHPRVKEIELDDESEIPHYLPKKSKLPILIAGLAVVALGAIFAVWWFVIRTPSSTTTGGDSGVSGSNRLTVSKPGGGGQFTTVRDALVKAGDGTRIAILDTPWEEELTISKARGITIEGAEGKEIVWKPGPRSTQQIVTLIHPENVKIRGLTFDGDNRVALGLNITEKVAGLVLEDLTIRNCNESAIHFRDCVGTESNPAIVQRVRIQSNPSKAAASGIAFFATGKTKANESIAIRDCRLEGPFSGGAFEFDGTTSRIELRNNRIWQAADGIYFKELKPGYAYRVRVVNNTFHTITDAGIRFRNANLLIQQQSPQQSIELEQNYFANTKDLLRADDDKYDKNLFRLLADNARNKATKEGKLSINAVEFDENLPTNPAEEKLFLRYDRKSKLNTLGQNQKPVGAMPE